MADNRIELVARIDTATSISEINSQDIPKMQDGVKALQIKCTIDSESIKAIKSQLSGIKIDVGGVNINSSSINNSVSKTVNDIQRNLSTSAKVDLSMNSTEIEQFIDKLTSLNVYGINIAELQKRFEGLNVSIESITPTFTTLEEGGEKALSSLSVKGKDSFGNLVSYVETYNAKTGEFVKGTTKVTESLSRVERVQARVQKETDNAQRAYNDFLKLQGKFDVYSKQYDGNEQLATQFQKISGLIADFKNTDPLDKQRESIIKIDNALKLLEVDLKSVKSASTTAGGSNSFYPSIANTGSTSDILASAKSSLNEAFANSEDRVADKADRVKRAIEDTSGSLQRFYVQVERGDKSVETLTYALNEQGTAYEYLGKVVREADNSTDFRSKDINTQWDIQTEKVRGFAAQLQRAGLTSEEFKKGLESLQAKLSARGDNNAMHSFLDDFDLLKAKAAATTQEIQTTNKAMREEDAVTTLGYRIKSTASALESWGNANRKAVTSTKQMSGETTTYAEKFAELTRRINEYKVKMQNGTLTPADISNFRHLTEEVNAYKKSADAAGLTTSRFFTNMNSQLRMVLQRWISLYAVIGYIRKIVEEVKALDTAMINLKRVTDETEESYQKFLERANSNASALKTTTSSIVEQSYQWAKLGYSMDEALELANASTIYMRVGDVDQSQALSNLVTSLKAFKLEAKDTMGVVDKLDKLNNNFAVSASGLGQGLERSASAMAMTGNSLDQTLALLTGAGEITQNLENTGRKVAHKKLYRLKS